MAWMAGEESHAGEEKCDTESWNWNWNWKKEWERRKMRMKKLY